MGNEQSNTVDLAGYHVLKVHPDSPGSKAGLITYFDFIVAVNGVALLKEDSTLVDQLQANENKPMVLTLYNTRTSSTRDVSITPTSNWGGAGLLGVTIRFSSIAQAIEYVWHVLEVHPNSPAAEAGIEPLVEYIVGTSDLLFTSEDDLSNLVYGNLGRPVILYVYNTKTEDIRDVTLIPNDNWGGEGCLGAEVGFGFLHRVPLRDEEAEAAEQREQERIRALEMEAQSRAQAQAQAQAEQQQQQALQQAQQKQQVASGGGDGGVDGNNGEKQEGQSATILSEPEPIEVGGDEPEPKPDTVKSVGDSNGGDGEAEKMASSGVSGSVDKVADDVAAVKLENEK